MYLKHIVKYYKDLVRLKFNSNGNSRFGKEILKEIKRGKYLDVGCYHPIKESHTAILYNNGWTGINLDISKFQSESIKNLMKDYHNQSF